MRQGRIIPKDGKTTAHKTTGRGRGTENARGGGRVRVGEKAAKNRVNKCKGERDDEKVQVQANCLFCTISRCNVRPTAGNVQWCTMGTKTTPTHTYYRIPRQLRSGCYATQRQQHDTRASSFGRSLHADGIARARNNVSQYNGRQPLLQVYTCQ